MKKKMENTPQNRSKNHVSASGTCLDRSGMVDLPGEKIISQKAPRNDSFRPFLIFQHFFLKNDKAFWPFCYLQPICCVSVCPQGHFFHNKKNFWRKGVIYLFKKLKKRHFFVKKNIIVFHLPGSLSITQ